MNPEPAATDTSGGLAAIREQLEEFARNSPDLGLSSSVRSADRGRDGAQFNWQLERNAQQAVREAAVLILFGALDDHPARYRDAVVPAELDLLFVQRAHTLTHHPGQVAFPGGSLDAGDASPAAAALREAVEETGLAAAGVEILATLAPIDLPVSNFLVHPVLAWWAEPSDVAVMDPAESARVFRVPVADLIDPRHRRTVRLQRGHRVHKSPGFTVADTLIWGFTGFIVDTLIQRLGWEQPWDRNNTVTPPPTQLPARPAPADGQASGD